MKDKKWYVISSATIVCILLNLLGRVVAEKYSFPLWLDSLGTFIMAYAAGPVCGAIVGLVNNLIYGIFVDMQTIYCFVGAIIGAIVGIAAKKKVFENLFKVVTLGMCLAILCTIISVLLSAAVYGGSIGNIWGDQMVRMCIDSGIPTFISWIIGQFYIEFLDKFVAVTSVYLLIQIVRSIRKKSHNGIKKISSGLLAFVISTAVAMIFCSTTALAAGDDYNEYTQLTYGNAQGLLAGEANDVVQTKDGRIWIGTYAGLYSYDGTRFKPHNDIDTIRNVNAMYVDEEGRLWVATNDNGFTILINGKSMNTMDEENGLPSNTVKNITCDNQGNYYIGTSEGLAIVELNGGVKIKKTYAGIKNISSLTSDENGNVVAITDNGKMYWFCDCENIANPINDTSDYEINCAYFSQNGFLYLGGADNHVLSYKMTNNKPYREKAFLCGMLENINSFYENEEGEMFVCSDNGVGYFTEKRNYKSIYTNQFESSVESMIVDYQGDLWFASSRLGLLKLSKTAFADVFSEAGQTQHVTNATVIWEDKLYCGTDDGLFVINDKKKLAESNLVTHELENVRIRGLVVDSKNNLWITTTGSGVFCVSSIGQKKYNIKQYTSADGLPGMRFRNVMEDSRGRVVVSGDEGVAYIKNGKVVKTLSSEDGLDNIKSLCLLEIGDVMYIGSDGGGISVVIDGSVQKTIKRTDGLSSDVILRMVYEPRSKGIFVVASNGINYIAADGSIKQLDNFPYSNNFDIIYIDSETVWITSSAGIYIAKVENLIANEEGVDYELINSNKGLRTSVTANSWHCLVDDTLYLCCDTGVEKVNLVESDLSSKSYRMIMDRVKVDGIYHEISRTAPLTVPSDTVRIEFEPEILNYSLNDPYVSFYLEGQDTEEKTSLLSEMESITYSNLKPGRYNFIISVWDSKKENVIESGNYTLIVENEMYQNWWFKLYVILVTALIIVWISWFITRTQMQKRLLKQELELEYTKKQLSMGKETILSIAHTVDAKDSNTSQHSFRVSEYSVAIAKRYGMDDESCENLRQMALLHDIGKIGIPDSILNKDEKLNDEEYKIMKTHVTRGAEILKDFTLIKNVNYGVLYHHEKYDGTGYCQGLKGEEIPIEARIIGIADTFDAMTANRVYRKGLALEVVIEELKRCKGTQFDPNLVDIMLELIDEGVIDITKNDNRSGEEE